MTDLTPFARPYAKAAFEFAVEQSDIAGWASLLELMTLTVRDPLSLGFIADPSSTPSQHHDLLISILDKFGAKHHQHSAFRNFIALLAHNKRILTIPSIFEQFQRLRADYEKTLVVEVVSFSDLTAEQINELKIRLGKRLGREITLKVTLDPALLGGAIIRAGDLVFDGSVRTQIKNLSNLMAA